MFVLTVRAGRGQLVRLAEENWLEASFACRVLVPEGAARGLAASGYRLSIRCCVHAVCRARSSCAVRSARPRSR